MNKLFAGVACALCVAAPVVADDGTLTLDRLHDTSDFRTEGLGRLRWGEDGRHYTTLEHADGGGRDIVEHDAATGEARIIVAASRLVPPDRDAPLSIADYQWSGDGRRLLVFTNTRRVWRLHSRGDYWVLDLASDDLVRLGVDLESTWFQFAKFAPDGDRVAYVHRHDLYVEDLGDHTLVRLTDSGSDTVTNGTFDWAYEEEWGLRDGFRWSPDGASIAFWRIDAADVGQFPLVDAAEAPYPSVRMIRYPKVGTTNPRCRIGVVRADDPADRRWLALPGDERDDYVARMEWAPDDGHGAPILMQLLNRRQNLDRVLLADPTSGAVREVFRDEDAAWVEVCDDLVWIEDGAAFTFTSERDGWRHLYRVSRDGTSVRNLTPGDYDVIEVSRIDEASGLVYLIASPGVPTERFLYRVPLTGGPAQRVTPASAPRGTHAYDIAPGARFAVHTQSRLDDPPRIAMVSLPEHARLRSLVDNDDVRAHVSALERGPAEFFRVPISDDLEVDGYAIHPPHLDPARRYPVLVYVYGEPAGQTVRNAWGGDNYLWHLLLAQRGYVVVSLDNRGTPAPRGRAWRKAVYGQIGTLASADQAAAVRALLADRPYLDPERVGVWGWSGGGSMTLNALFRYPELYDVGIAIAFVANQRWYDTIYQERYMGLPDDNPDGYAEGSPITHAHRLEGDLLLVYGTTDDNCHFQNCAALIDKLVAHGLQFDMIAYPGRTHSISEKRGTRKHLYTTMLRYLTDHLAPGPR